MKRLLGLVFVAVVALTLPPAVHAQDDSNSQTEGAAAQIALVIDASGSMRAEDVDGGSRMDAAKEAASRVVDELPSDTNFSLLTYGSTVAEETGDIAAGCRDITVLQPLGPVDANAAKDEINGVEAIGYTPIGESLRAAADQLDGEGERSIILVSDGIDTCAPPPVCEVAKELADSGIDLAIHTVGFRVDDAARAELDCIANVTGGTYTDAENTDQLSEELSAIAQQAAGDYEVTGTPFEFGDVYLGEGLYVGELEGPEPAETIFGEPGPTKSFKLVAPDDHIVRVIGGVTPIYQQDSVHSGLEIVASNPTCDLKEDAYEIYEAGRDAPGATMLAFTPDSNECDAEAWEISLTREGTEDPEARPVEIVIGYEPIPDETEMGPDDDRKDADKEDVPDLEKNIAVEQATPGTSLGSAVEVEPGRYAAEILPGQAHYYKIPVEWGQRPVAQADFEPQQGDGNRSAKLEIATPMRVKLGIGFSEQLDEDTAVTVTNTNADWAFYRNRTKDVAYAGDWYVMVNLDGGEDNAKPSAPETYELTIIRDGAKVDGPSWRLPDQPGPEPTVEPVSSTSETTVAESSPGRTDTDTTDQAQQSDESGSGSAFPVLVAVIGVLIALLVRRRH